MIDVQPIMKTKFTATWSTEQDGLGAYSILGQK